jgi:hypothetical protein
MIYPFKGAIMKLRYLTVVNEYGQKKTTLQYWNKDFGFWEDIPEIEIKENEMIEAINTYDFPF